ncbi:winged helix-turn-helix domain-containing tetratricopeptide repeat protein [Taklimakanibacter deserti]|uniref:winged helix-turn-helix domain-containing tetratricopeptide repeat protein n=1 Tax=Taklimakanibacter deserti TaxID=2267839 RepID=UPI000E64AC62
MSVADEVFRFGRFTLDLRKGTIEQDDEPLFLRPKAYACLTHLARNMGRVVPKGELLETVWPGVYVTEDSLTQSIREIRKVLGDELVRTVSKRGYMLAAGTGPQALPEIGNQPIVAVLRFRNEGGDPANEAIVDGLAEDIINGLARFGTLTVLARNTSFSFASHAAAEWGEIRSRIGADFLVEGSVRRQEDRVLAAVNLIDAKVGSQLWGERYQAEGEGFFAIERDIVEAIIGRLVHRVTATGLKRSSRKPITSLATYELVLKGVTLLRDPAQADLEGAEALFNAAIARDPAYGLAYTYLALARSLNAEFYPVEPEILAQARDFADKGAQLAPDQATSRRIQSLVRAFMRQHEAAEHYLRIALELNPFDADCIEQMGYLLVMRGKPVDGLAWLARAQRIDPLQPYWFEFDRSLALYLIGDYRAAAETLEQSTKQTPWIRTRLAACYAQLGEIDEARRQIALIDDMGGKFSARAYMKIIPFESPADAAHFEEGVLLALGEKS